jgi:hypothetical protein
MRVDVKIDWISAATWKKALVWTPTMWTACGPVVLVRAGWKQILAANMPRHGVPYLGLCMASGDGE